MATKRKAPAKRSVSAGRAPKRFEDLTVKDIVNRRVQSVRPDLTGDKVASVLLKAGGAVPVVDRSKQLLGVVSEHDVLVALDEGHTWGARTVRDLMSANPYSVRPETSVPTLVHVLTESDLLSVPVVNERNRLLGMVTRRDVVRAALRPAAKRRS
ncbi:MAG TPA: CBS domain-containing protein [Nitrospira sp.]|nr:CBS domain-containing protein [Nitrospira sp. NTP1]HQR13649.1 CBS domain-containing protein [Nitrospira sp.]HQV10420.1 CBS domain-containing protein [Nitrospira sp.]